MHRGTFGVEELEDRGDMKVLPAIIDNSEILLREKRAPDCVFHDVYILFALRGYYARMVDPNGSANFAQKAA